jgi:predicted nucleotidyltransferase/DNA-binding XRE family transcriptional regulator
MATRSNHFGTLLRHHRDGTGLTLREVAERIGVDLSLVGKWEQGSRKPSAEEVGALARVLHVEPRPLLTAWYTDKVLYELPDDDLAIEVLKAAEEQVAYRAFARTDRKALERQLKTVLRRFPQVRQAWVFGSFARQDDRPGSDIDLAIEADKGFSYFDLAELQHQLQERIGRKVDVGFLDSFKPHLKERITPDLRLIHAR